MQAFAKLLNSLLHAPQRNTKLRLIEDYLCTVPDPDRGYGLAALTGDLSLRSAKASAIRRLIEDRYDAELFRLAYDFVGDLAETTALLWPTSRAPTSPPLSTVITTLEGLERDAVDTQLANWLDGLDSDGRWALLKLITGGLRVGVSARLAKLAVATYGSVEPAEIEEVWHGLTPPYRPLFAWLDGQASKPCFRDLPVFRPLMLAHPIEQRELEALDLNDYAVEWKWDGARVQIAAIGSDVRLYARSGDDISMSFPDLIEPLKAHSLTAVLDGELLIGRGEWLGQFNDLQQRLGRKTVSRAMQQRLPAMVRLYDILSVEDDDVRSWPFHRRRDRLETFYHSALSPSLHAMLDLSTIVAAPSLDQLDVWRRACRGEVKEGLMLKHKHSTYEAGRPRGAWYKWKRDPLNLDCVLMYAQRGHGRRSSFYSDFTFGAWRPNGSGGEELVPVGKAYFGFSDEELVQLDRWVRNHTTNRFGPVREVEPALVLEIGFDSVHHSQRHKSGVAMRFPRVLRIRWDKPALEADRLTTLKGLIDEG